MKISELMGLKRSLYASVGLEVEIEGEQLPFIDTHNWRTDRDGSLKTDEAFEYVLKNPISYAKTDAVLDELKKILDYNSLVYDSERAGVHVHINMQRDTVESVIAFACTYYLFEEVLLNFCGEKRSGNLFCLRLKDAEAPLDYLERFSTTHSLGALSSDKIRYASLNLSALPKYGSLEFRGMRSTPDFSQLKLWVRMLIKLRSFARRVKKPEALCKYITGIENKDTNLGVSVFGEELWKHLEYPGWEESLHESLLLILPLIRPSIFVPRTQQEQGGVHSPFGLKLAIDIFGEQPL